MSRAEAEVRKQSKRRTSAAPKVTAPRPARAARSASGGSGGAPSPKARMSKESLLGHEPRVDLLPTEVHADRKARGVVRRAWFGVGVVAAIVALATGAAYGTSVRAGTELAASQATSTALLQQQAKYSELRATEQESALIRAGQEVGGSTEIDWSDYLRTVQAQLPQGVQITGLAIDSASPTTEYAQATAPLQGARIGTLALTASSTEFPSVPDWIASLQDLPGFVDANAESVSLDQTSGAYDADITIHINTDAYDGKYAAKDGN